VAAVRQIGFGIVHRAALKTAAKALRVRAALGQTVRLARTPYCRRTQTGTTHATHATNAQPDTGGPMTVTAKKNKNRTRDGRTRAASGRAAAPAAPEANANFNGTGVGAERRPLHQCVTEALARYFQTLDGEPPVGLYELVMSEVERPLLAFIMQELGGNQSRAAEILGLNRATLRKKLIHHGLLES
jgi:Fis family transcriptional regulator, factor for inversion stimulation protein